ncbi:MAG: hypothetical protein QNK37_26035 [Acidobacteriota bacterium]|nr:hypothetical protein [Acidobacteriota bacterium]
MNGSPLEQRLRNLIDAYRGLKQEKLEMSGLIAMQEERIAKLEQDSKSLRSQIDELNRDRFVVKKLKDERKVIRRKLETALSRLAELEKEL